MKIFFHARITKDATGQEINIQADFKQNDIPKTREIVGFGFKENGVWKILIDKNIIRDQAYTDFKNGCGRLIAEAYERNISLTIEFLN
jgi:hypothetical protein